METGKRNTYPPGAKSAGNCHLLEDACEESVPRKARESNPKAVANVLISKPPSIRLISYSLGGVGSPSSQSGTDTNPLSKGQRNGWPDEHDT